MENGGDLRDERKKRRQYIVDSSVLLADRGCLEKRNEAERAAQGDHDLNNNCRECMSTLSRLTRG